MGFFKKIGQGIKKFAKKNINFKSLVKVGSMVDPSGIVSGLSAQHEQKKMEREQEAQAVAEAQAYEAQMKSKNPNIGEILTGAAGGALSGAGQVLAGSTKAGEAGATLVESTTNAWFKRNWLKLVGAVLGATTVVVLFVRVLRPKRQGYRRR
ncbi:hypothetical protein Q361_10946 [Flavobacterium croceum DSM 17960]|uniref:Uncharacterized protein n=1 Tax=Flavobacterium croceum DSM 17960 TaxID=1121886 RepID=A0A2S4N7A1_9FLAO|nr:hypothetical protein [Flavobacterium croceum]POS01586.1 hypothetical protein Q361_10946 [Flavobacterium croceum DSM 17960]